MEKWGQSPTRKENEEKKKKTPLADSRKMTPEKTVEIEVAEERGGKNTQLTSSIETEWEEAEGG